MILNPQETAGLVTFTGEILNGKLYFLCNDRHDQALGYSISYEGNGHLNLVTNSSR